jgi:hypothetical protein
MVAGGFSAALFAFGRFARVRAAAAQESIDR